MLQSPGSDYSRTYQSLADAFSDSLAWEYDDRFDGIVAVFEAGDKNRVSDIVSSQLAQVWDNSTIKKAPTRVSGALKAFGGLQPGQLVFSSDSTQDIILLGLWWPWGNGATISIRFVPHLIDSLENEKKATLAALQYAFGLQKR